MAHVSIPDTLLVTALDRAIIPPPMCAATIAHPEPLLLHAVSRHQSRIAALGAESGRVYVSSLAAVQPAVVCQLERDIVASVRQMVFAGGEHVALLGWNHLSSKESVHFVRLSDGHILSSTNVPAALRLLAGWGNDVVLLTADSSVIKIFIGM